jgi:hypothetical protein
MFRARSRIAFSLPVLLCLPLAGSAQPAPPTPNRAPTELVDRVEGNWEVTATNSPEPGKSEISYVPLRKAWQLQLNGVPFTPGGSFQTGIGANWSYVRPDDAAWLEYNYAKVAYQPSGEMTLTGYWGRVSTFRPVSRDMMHGTWVHGGRSGEETWRRLSPRITAIEFGGLTPNRVANGDGPGRLHFNYDGSDGMRGNKREFEIRIFGENLWGYHYVWVEGTDIEAYWSWPITDPAANVPGNVIGLKLRGYVWSKVTPGTKQLHVDGLTIPFQLDLEGMPDETVALEWLVAERTGAWRVATAAVIGSDIRLRARTARDAGADHIDTTVNIARGNGPKDLRPFRLTRKQPGAVLESTVQHLVTGAPTAPDMIHAAVGDRLEAAQNGRTAVLAIIPAAAFHGPELQQMCELLSVRLVEYYQLEARQRAEFAELNRLVAGARDRPRNLPEAGALRAAITEWQERTDAFNTDLERARVARANLDAAESAFTHADAVLGAARTNLRLDSRTLLPIAPPAAPAPRPRENQGRLASDLLRERNLMLENLRANGAGADLLRERENEVHELEAAITRALGDKQRARDAALAARDSARTARHAAPAPDENAVLTAWSAVRSAADQARERLPETYRRSMPTLPNLRTDPAAARVAGQALQGLTDSLGALDAMRTTLRRNLSEHLAEVDRIDLALVPLGRSINNLRAAATVEAEMALEALGAEKEDPTWAALTRLREGIAKAKEVIEPADGQLDQLEKLRADLTHSEEGAKLIEAAKEHLGTVVETLTFLEEQGERLQKVHELQEQLREPRTALTALSLLLKNTSDAISSVPVLGATVGRALSLYAQVAEAAGQAAIRIQDHLIKVSLENFAQNPRPEQHLYIMDEIPASIPTEAHERVRTMLQLRRLMALLKADNVNQARNAPYSPR